MKLNKLDKATKIYKAIQMLDEEIIKIEKRANELANGERPQNMFSFSFILSGDSAVKKEDAKNELEIKINEKESLYMIGALLSVGFE